MYCGRGGSRKKSGRGMGGRGIVLEGWAVVVGVGGCGGGGLWVGGSAEAWQSLNHFALVQPVPKDVLR